MTRTYRRCCQYDILRADDNAMWMKPTIRTYTWRGRRWDPETKEFGPIREYTRTYNPENYTPEGERRYHMREGRRPLLRDRAACGCGICRSTQSRREERRRRRHRAKEAIRKGQWDDLPFPMERE